MNWEVIKGQWRQFTGKIKTQWGKLTDDDLVTVNGQRDVLLGKLQERYGCAKEEADRQLKEFESRL